MSIINHIKNKIQDIGHLIFFHEIIKNPAAIGAIYPSSNRLAHQLAKQVPLPVEGYVLELGAGTGVVTQALINRGIPRNKITVVERSPALVKLLRKQFPDLCIIEGDAIHLTQLLSEKANQITTIVSSLPLRSLPPASADKIGQEIDKILAPAGRLIQYTYSFRSYMPHFSGHAKKIYSQWVWINIPPALVEVFVAN